ncbi:MAG: HAD hydrolase-like protein [Solirubrobacterales bacterium]|nr:HAD hydrolase-like protein [Solirubrobacterales bacterium]
MALPSKVSWVTFDVYGTLIDWEAGIFAAFKKEAKRDGFAIEDRDRDQIITLFHEYSKDVEGGSYELYAEVLRQVAVKIAKEIGWPLEPSRAGFLPDSVPRWMPFRETAPQLKKFFANYQTGLIANADDKLLGLTRRHIPGNYDLVVTAQQVRSYKPEPAHFNEFARRVGSKKGWVHIGSSYYHDVEPCLKLKVPVIWVNRRKEELESGQKKPTAEVRPMLEAAKLLGV